MKLESIFYYEHKNENNYWELKDLNITNFTLLVGVNSTGKTRALNVINHYALIISGKEIIDGNFFSRFIDEDNNSIEYEIVIENKKVILEKMKKNKQELINREEESCKVYSEMQKKHISISPPENALTIHVRRDIKEYPVFEKIINWGKGVIRFNFTKGDPNSVNIDSSQFRDDFSNSSAFLDKIIKNTTLIETLKPEIISDMKEIGYLIEDFGTEKIPTNIASGIIPILYLKENDLNCKTLQSNMSQGMYRAFSIILLIEYILKSKENRIILIDDLGEGLDFERSANLLKLLYKKIKNSSIQMILASNDRFLINAVEIQNINYLERKGHIVNVFNYKNNKSIIEKYKDIGLTSFDILTKKLYQPEN